MRSDYTAIDLTSMLGLPTFALVDQFLYIWSAGFSMGGCMDDHLHAL